MSNIPEDLRYSEDHLWSALRILRTARGRLPPTNVAPSEVDLRQPAPQASPLPRLRLPAIGPWRTPLWLRAAACSGASALMGLASGCQHVAELDLVSRSPS